MSEQLAVVRFFRGERDTADEELRADVIQARAAGCSLRRIASAADVSHVKILGILQPARRHSATFDGTDAEYQANHNRVRDLRGTPQQCDRCGTTDPDKTYDWANLSGRYEDPADYERMCRRCHRVFDSKGQPVVNGARPSRSISASVDLSDVFRAADRRKAADRGLRESILRAREAGEALRPIAEAAGITHPTVLQIVRDAKVVNT